jgi:DNA repair exonuclease SbcCD ATPase subunit
MLSGKDVLSIFLTSLSTAIGVSFPFLPTPLPDPLSLTLLAGVAVTCASLSALIQAVGVERDSRLEKQLDQAYRTGANEARIEELKQRVAELDTEQDHISEEYESRGNLLDTIESRIMTLEEVVAEGSEDIVTEEFKSNSEQLKKIESEVSELKKESKQLEELESEATELKKEIKQVRKENVGNFEFEERIEDIEETTQNNKNYILKLYRIIKDNVDGFEQSETSDTRKSESSSISGYSSESEQELETEKG